MFFIYPSFGIYSTFSQFNKILYFLLGAIRASNFFHLHVCINVLLFYYLKLLMIDVNVLLCIYVNDRLNDND